MKHCTRLWILLCITVIACTTPAFSAPDESEAAETIASPLGASQNKSVTKTPENSLKVYAVFSPLGEYQNKTVTKASKRTKKSKKVSKKPKSPAQASESKQVISSALKSMKPLKKLKLERITRFVRENKVQLTIIIAVALFRKEILRLAWRLLSKPVTNAETGSSQRVLSVPPIRILQLLFVLEMIRRMHQSNSTANVSPLATALLPGRANPAVALFLSKLLSPGSSIYLPPTKQHFTFETLNDRYNKDQLAFHKAVHTNRLPSQSSSNMTDLIPTIMKHAMVGSQPSFHETIVVMDWTSLDTSVSRMDIMRDEISFLLNIYETQGDVDPAPRFREVVVLLESQGGSASDYSLASQQILRLRKKGVKVTICVDKVAASGGYMIACTSSPGCLLAAPFAVLGSIGVLGQTINIQKTLEGWGVRPLVFKGGKDKAPVGLIGDITRDGMAKVQQMIDKTHVAFKQHVSTYRPLIAADIDAIATGDIWLGYEALSMGLVDRITTSDEYIGEKVSGGANVLKLVQLVRGRYPFQQPTTTSGIQHNDQLLGLRSSHATQYLGTIIDGIRNGLSLLQKGDNIAWAKYMGTEIRMKESFT